MRKLLLLLCSVFVAEAQAQSDNFSVRLEPLNISNLGGLQSYAYAQYGGKWLIVGGRLDGLHRRQPFASFDEAGHNNQMFVIDPVAGQVWSAPLSVLAVDLREQLSATNMEFHQEGDYLYIVGGYGYSASVGLHRTYPFLTAIDVPAVVDAIESGLGLNTYQFRQVSDTMFAVTGGHLKKLYDNYYLVGGQRFDGAYNPMGPDHGPGFVQVYTNAIRRFALNDDGTNITINHLSPIIDAAQLHRRDYNVVSQIMPDGSYGITAFSGVFQHLVDLPFLNCVNIDTTGYVVNNDFSQYYNHYHCANIPLYSAADNKMHTVFFGGIAQYYDSLGVLVQDNNVPFVKTIARVTRSSTGEMLEYKLPIEMPALVGASAEFIALESIAKYENEVLKLDSITADTTLVGYIYGGINSSAPNIFWINTGVESQASSQIYKVYLIKNAIAAAPQLNEQSRSSLRLQVFPNPSDGFFTVKFNLQQPEKTQLTIVDGSGRQVLKTLLEDTTSGENIYSIENISNRGVYFVTLETSKERTTQKVVIQP